VSVLSLAPETGRTHQIRVHLKYINHPIVGDYLYAGRKTSRNDRVWAPRVMLHAWKMTLTHPITALPLAIEAPIPDDMDSIIRKSTNTTNLQMNEKLT
jgi:23S rRNA pseudouridine1911/1915/1917 synthase